jgi:hypothetical protein
LSWSIKFEDPIALPNDRQLVTSRDAKLPKAEQDLEVWQIALRALHHDRERNPDRS